MRNNFILIFSTLFISSCQQSQAPLPGTIVKKTYRLPYDEICTRVQGSGRVNIVVYDTVHHPESFMIQVVTLEGKNSVNYTLDKKEWSRLSEGELFTDTAN